MALVTASAGPSASAAQSVVSKVLASHKIAKAAPVEVEAPIMPVSQPMMSAV